MAEIVKLVTYEDTVKENIVEILEEVLAKAKNGELKGLAISGVFQDGSAMTAISRSDCRPTVVGAISLTLARLTRQVQQEVDA